MCPPPPLPPCPARAPASRSPGSPTLVDGVECFVRPDGTVTAVNATKGTELWKRDTGIENLSAPVLSKKYGHLYFTNRYGRLLALDRDNGRGQWSTDKLDDPGTSAEDRIPSVSLVQDAIVAVAGGVAFSVSPARPEARPSRTAAGIPKFIERSDPWEPAAACGTLCSIHGLARHFSAPVVEHGPDGGPGTMDRRRYHPSMATAAEERLLRTITDPHHRAIVENKRLHALLEVTGNWERILTPEMTVDHPHYVHSDGERVHVYDGRDEVADFYRSLIDAGIAALLGPIEMKIMVSDWGLAMQGLWGAQLSGAVAVEWGLDVDDPDPDVHYYMQQITTEVWAYNENAQLIGEHISEDRSSRTFWKLDPSEVMSTEEAYAILTPKLNELLSAAPLS